MITRLLKLFVYAFFVFFAIAGLISMKDKFMKFDSNESFEEQEEDNKKDESNDEVEEDTTDAQPEPSSSQSATENSSKINDELTGNIDEKICNPDVVRQIKRNFVTKFNNFKNNLNNDLNIFQRVLESDIHNMFIEKEENENETPKEGVDPVVMYDSNENDLSDNEDEDEEELKETFIQDMYDGITSPYCLNCREL